MDIYFDTEFTDLVHPQLISVGFAAVDGTTLYVEVDDWAVGDCSQFVRGAVLPLLDPATRLPSRAVAQRIDEWLRAFGEPLRLYSDAAIDWQLLAELQHEAGMPPLPDIRPAVRIPPMAGELVREALYDRKSLRRHHALDDAHALRAAWQALLRLDEAARAEAVAEEPLKLWLDDLRPTPEGWVRAETAAEAIALLQLHRFDAISLDHDLGEDPVAGNGYQALEWLERMVATSSFTPPAQIAVHSSNPPALTRMRAAIDAIQRIRTRRSEERS